MKIVKKIGLIVLTCVFIFAVGFVGMGLIMKQAMRGKYMDGFIPSSIASSLEIMANPTGSSSIALPRDINVTYVMSQVMGDYYQESTQYYNIKMVLLDSTLLLDRNLNVIQEGDTITVGKERWPDKKSVLSYLDEDLFVGQIAIRRSFTLEQRLELAAKLNFDTMSIRMDSYYLDQGWYYPEHISVVQDENDSVVLEMDCTVPVGVSGMLETNDAKWILLGKVDQLQTNAVFGTDKEEMLAFAKKHKDKIFLTKQDFDVSNPLIGVKKYHTMSNSQYVMLRKTEISFGPLAIHFAIIAAIVSVVLTASIWTIIWIVGKMKRR